MGEPKTEGKAIFICGDSDAAEIKQKGNLFREIEEGVSSVETK